MIKFNVNSGDLCNRLQVLAKSQASRNSISILECVKIDVEDGAIMLTAGDGDNLIQSCLSVEVQEGKGEAVCIRTDNLLVGLRELPNQPITITANEKADMDIRVDYANGHFSFVGQSAVDYPFPPTLDDDARFFHLAGEKLRLGVSVCKKMVADDELRPVMCGIYFDLNTANKLTMVASNGQALAREIFDIENEIDPIAFNLPHKAALLLTNIIEKNGEEVVVSVDNNRAQFKTNDYTMTCKLIEGKYPNYNSVIPKENPIVVNLPKETLVCCLRRILISASDNTPLISMQLTNGNLLLSAKDDALGTAAEETINCEYEGNKFAIGFKGTLLLDILGAMPSGTVDVNLSHPTHAALIVPHEKTDGEDLTMLCMPMMLNE